jgi:hypothetical protein
LIVFLIFSTPAQATEKEIRGILFKNHYNAGKVRLDLLGAGLLRYLGIFEPYVGAFYLEAGVNKDHALLNHAKRIEVEYLRSFKKEDFGAATNASLKKNLSTDQFEKLKTKIEYHNSLYEDIQIGDRYSLTYIPGEGTVLALNGEPKGMISGPEFAAAIFSIWLGKKPINESFKKALLGLK